MVITQQLSVASGGLSDNLVAFSAGQGCTPSLSLSRSFSVLYYMPWVPFKALEKWVTVSDYRACMLDSWASLWQIWGESFTYQIEPFYFFPTHKARNVMSLNGLEFKECILWSWVNFTWVLVCGFMQQLAGEPCYLQKWGGRGKGLIPRCAELGKKRNSPQNRL